MGPKARGASATVPRAHAFEYGARVATRKASPRTKRREAERAAVKDVRARERVAALEPGGAADRPVEVASASVVEAHARATRCPQCGGALRVEEHVAVELAGRRLRVARVACLTCGARRSLYYRIAQPS